MPESWTFKNVEVAGKFDAHVREQLPWYDAATFAVEHVARHHVLEHSVVYDVGASTGNVSRALADTVIARNAAVVGIENSHQMADLYSVPNTRNFTLKVADAFDYEFDRHSVSIFMLSLMFMDPGRRMDLLDRVWSLALPGGCQIVIDKCLPVGGYASTVMWRLTLAGKVSANVDPREIVEKELSLAGVQIPIDPDHFQTGEWVEFFRFGDFAGWFRQRL